MKTHKFSPRHRKSSLARPVNPTPTAVGNHIGGYKFERGVREEIEQRFPCCTLANVVLFLNESARFVKVEHRDPLLGDHAPEIDLLLHVAGETEDRLLIVECKDGPVDLLGPTKWEPLCEKGPRNVQEQVVLQAKALKSHLRSRASARPLQIEGFVVSGNNRTKPIEQLSGWDIPLSLMSKPDFLQFLEKMQSPPMPVAQSELLGLLRLGIAVPELGHPELNNAISYIERCREDLDGALFRVFDPKKERWAIEGSAGMGKSVLLAYSLFVLSTDRRLKIVDDKRTFVSFEDEAARLMLPPLGRRRVFAFALREKQKQVIETHFRRFAEEFLRHSSEPVFGVPRPQIRLWKSSEPLDCDVLLVDEVHDLPTADAERIRNWAYAGGEPHYLVVANDSHQKLHSIGDSERIIDRLSFDERITRLRLNYRNPAPIYAASLGLMFRWFAKKGPKIMPSPDEFKNAFGLGAEQYGAGFTRVTVEQDSHPGNSWSNCVNILPNCETAFTRLSPYQLRSQDVLWARFGEEDEHFDYEKLNCFTYHDLSSKQSGWLVDKYIKGQDFPIVVIQGFSPDMDNLGGGKPQMWKRRKELYVCCSRATGFLFFIPSKNSQAGHCLTAEVDEIVRQLSAPRREIRFSRTWKFDISPASETIRLSQRLEKPARAK